MRSHIGSRTYFMTVLLCRTQSMKVITLLHLTTCKTDDFRRGAGCGHKLLSLTHSQSRQTLVCLMPAVCAASDVGFGDVPLDSLATRHLSRSPSASLPLPPFPPPSAHRATALQWKLELCPAPMNTTHARRPSVQPLQN